MHCENLFCIYWENNECTLEEISLDIQGNCQGCIYVDLEEKLLKNKREELLNKLESYH